MPDIGSISAQFRDIIASTINHTKWIDPNIMKGVYSNSIIPVTPQPYSEIVKDQDLNNDYYGEKEESEEEVWESIIPKIEQTEPISFFENVIFNINIQKAVTTAYRKI